MQTLNAMLKRTASTCLTPLALRAAKSYIAGPELADALRVAARLAKGGFRTTLGFWDGAGDSPVSVVQEYFRAIAALAGDGDDCYLSIKLPALGDSQALLDQLLAEARPVERLDRDLGYRELALGRATKRGATSPSDSRNATEGVPYRDDFQIGGGVALAEPSSPGNTAVRIHFDSLAPEEADATWSAALAAADAGNTISCSLPGRWRRSIADAEAAIEAGIIPRVVKGQWPDVDGQDIDMSAGFMDVVHRLAGRAPHVAVASHDVPLAREAIERLRAAGTSCELELLYGLPDRAAVALARKEGVPVRFYVPYGKAYLPYCLGQIRRQPRLLWWLLRDALLKA